MLSKGDDGLPMMKTEIDPSCVRCGHCESACPTGALQMDPTNYPAQKPMDPTLAVSPEQMTHHMLSRRSIRRYRSEPVDTKTLRELIEIARHAPSGHNGQPLHWIVIQDTQEVQRMTKIVVEWMRGLIKAKHPLAERLNLAFLVRAHDQGRDLILRHAPHIVVAHAAKDNNATIDVTIALTYLELAAPAFEVGTCWAGYFTIAASQSSEVKEALGIPENHVPLGALMLGYPMEKYYRYPERHAAKVSWK